MPINSRCAGRSFGAILLALSLCVATRQAAANDYAIKLDRASKVGEKEHLFVAVESKQSVKISSEGRETNRKEAAVQVTVEGVAETLAIDAKGNDTKARVVVERCEVTRDGKNQSLVNKGQALLAELKGDKTVFSIENGPALSDDDQEALTMALSLHDPGSASDDEVFGTAQRKRPGDTWPINAKAAAADFRRMDIGVKPEDISGQTTLVGVMDEGGLPCLHLQAQITAQNATPKDVKAEQAVMQMSMAALYPLDPTLGPRAGSVALKSTMRLRERNAQGKMVTVDTEYERTRSVKIAPAK